MQTTVSILRSLGFVIYNKKSIFNPTKVCKYLELVINPDELNVELTAERRLKIKDLVLSFMFKNSCKIKEMAKLNLATLGKNPRCCLPSYSIWLDELGITGMSKIPCSLIK